MAAVHRRILKIRGGTLAGPSGPACFWRLDHTKIGGFRFVAVWHQNGMHAQDFSPKYRLRMPADPEPFPIHEPPDPPENPDVPVREPDPEDPGQI